jgi:hypothetical protein
LLIDLLFARGIDAGVGGQIGDTANQLLGVGHQENMAFAELLQRFELASLVQPDLVVSGYGSAPQPGIDLEDPACDRAEFISKPRRLIETVR